MTTEREQGTDAGQRASTRRHAAMRRAQELRSRHEDLGHPAGGTVRSSTDAADALAAAVQRAVAAERSAIAAHESAALAHERAAAAHETAATRSTGEARQQHLTRAVALRAEADDERRSAAGLVGLSEEEGNPRSS